MSNPTWGVVMTVREPAQLVIANVHYHLGQGAAEVHVFLDDPDDPVGPHLAGVSGCVVYHCNEDHWQTVNLGRRPDRQTRRQALNANHVYQKGGLEWLVHLDADEFLFQKRSLADELKFAPRVPGYLGLPVRERAYVHGQQASLFDGVFRVPFTGRSAMMVPLYGELGPFLAHGVAGHAAGKSCVPVGRELRMGVHGPRTKKGKKLPPLHATSTVLLHFDGLTRLHWVLKMLRYAVGNPQRLIGPHRLAQLAFIEEHCQGLGEICEFHDMLKAVDDEQNARMSALGLLEDWAFDIGDAARAAVAEAGLSLSADVFDKDLRARNADLIDQFQP